MRAPDWTHFRSAEADPAGPCCLLEDAFPVNELPRNYIWTLGYIGTWPHHPEAAEISAQVKSYSREWLEERSRLLKEKRQEVAKKQSELADLRAKKRREDAQRTVHAANTMDGKEEIKRRVEASPLKMAQSLMKAGADLATGGMTDPKERMEICNSCPFKGDDQRCGKCGCFLPAKTRVKKATCPIGRW